MRYDDMVTALAAKLGDGGGQERTVLAATVQAISEVAWDEAADMRAQLPDEFTNVGPAGPGGRRSLDEFVARIGELSGARDEAQSREYAHLGFSTVGEAISAGQLRQLMEALPDEYGALAPNVTGLTGDAETLLAEVRRQAKLDRMEQARELTEAVLTVLAEAASGGQAANLATVLPQEIGAFLKAPEPARHTDSDRFFAEIVNRSTVTNRDTVRDQISAVFTTLSQWAPGELTDTLDQLPSTITTLSPIATGEA